jgi:hypothetical protein
MTGAEHYREAERLLTEAPRPADGYGPDLDTGKVALAQVHATLALAAATAMNGYRAGDMHPADFKAWDRACGVSPDAPERGDA